MLTKLCDLLIMKPLLFLGAWLERLVKHDDMEGRE